MKVLIAGGAGFIGSNYVRRILRGDYPEISEVVVIDKLTYAGRRDNLPADDKGFEFIQGDIQNPELIEKVLRRVDAVVNFAAESHVDRSINNPSSFFTTNILGVQNILESVRKYPSKIFLQVSTDEVYGSIETGSWDESQPLKPNSPYSASKASADLIIQSYFNTFDLNVKVTRCSNNYGPYQFPEKIIPRFISLLATGEKIPVYGDGLNRRDWLHVDDHCQGIHKVLTHGRAGDVYNIGGGKELSNLSLAKILIELVGGDDSAIEYVSDRKGHDYRYSVDFTKISSELGYTPNNEFDVGIRNTVTWYLENRAWWEKVLTA